MVVGFVAAPAAGRVAAAPTAGDSVASGPSWIPVIVGGLAAAVFAGSGWWRIRRVPVRPWRFGPGTGLATFALAVLVGAIAASVAEAVMGAEPDPSGPVSMLLPIMLVAWVAQLATAACLPWVRGFVEPDHHSGDGRMPRRGSVCPDRRRPRWAAGVLGVVGLALFWPMTLAVAMIAGLLWQSLTGHAPSEIAHTVLAQLAAEGPTAATIATSAALVVLPAIVEEVLYRGLLQESFRRAKLFSSGNPWHSIVLASLIFTAMHVGAVEPHALAGLFVLSLGFGWAYARTGRLTASITMHMAFNAGNILLAVFWV
ncbi:MAG: CPBP family intramembrane metalloprotease [Phycisphaerales bacterium]|jgi:membrane protease YdiL (CAAX protease family)|nr:CPBP family intramembrane metalloprotease [Phycisphaerales bacterium]